MANAKRMKEAQNTPVFSDNGGESHILRIENSVHIAGVTGSSPVSPTTNFPIKSKTEARDDTVTRGSSVPKRRPDVCTIYFISTDDVPDYPIKIGMTAGNLGARLKSLQTGCPHRLRVLAACEASPRAEWFLHLDLRPHRLNGEWFKRSPEVLEAVEQAHKNNHPTRRSKGIVKFGIPQKLGPHDQGH